MRFKDYIRTLQKFYKRTISDNELCTTLFDFVIDPIGLVNKNDEYLTLSKSKISQIMNGTAPINKQIRDHIYDDAIINSLVDNFNEFIIPKLSPEIDDLCYQMMELIKKDQISPSRKADFQMLANPNTVAAFLAKVFIYVIVNNSKASAVSDESQNIEIPENRNSNLILRGIKDNHILSDKVFLENFIDRFGMNRESILEEIRDLYSKASAIHLQKDISATSINSFPFTITLNNSLYEECVFDADKIKIINLVAEKMKINLPEDFYDYGNLKWNPFGGTNGFGLPIKTLLGTVEEKHKYQTIEKIYDSIQEYLAVAPFIEDFQKVLFVALAIQNTGTNYDQDVRVSLKIGKDKFLSAEDIVQFDQSSYKYLYSECDHELLFSIQKGLDYLEYEESENLKAHRVKMPPSSQLSPFGEDRTIDYVQEIKDIFGYFYTKDENGDYVLEVTIDNINQHTAVAFPTIILLKSPLEAISYTIRSKHMPSIISGSIIVSNSTT